MTMKKSTDFLTGEVIDLSTEIALVAPTDTPLYTMVAGRGQIVTAKDVTVTWREKELDGNRGTLKLEGAEAGSPIKSSRTMFDNYCQILEKVVSVSGTARAIKANGVGDEFLNEINDRLIELKRDVEWFFLQGTKTAEDTGTSTPRQMDGIINLVNANNVVDAATTALTEDMILDMLQKIWEAGALGSYTCFMNASEKRAFNNIFKNANNVRLLIDQTTNEFGVSVQRYDSDFGRIEVVLNRWMPSGTVLAVDLGFVEIAELRPAFYEDLAKTGDYFQGHVVVENTIKLLNSKAAGKIINLA